MFKYKIFILLIIILTFFNTAYSNENEWIMKITDKNGNMIKEMTKSDYKTEVSNFITLRGLSTNIADIFITNESERWAFINQIIEQELIYYKAIKEGYDEDESIISNVNKLLDDQISQLYAKETLDENILKITDKEKRDYWNKEEQRIRALYQGDGPLTYDKVEREIEYAIAQERLRDEYERIVNDAKEKYNIEASYNSNPAIVIENDYKVPLKDFEDSFDLTIKQSGQNLSSALLLEAKQNMFNSFLAKHILIYEAKKNGFYNTKKVKDLEEFLQKSAIVQSYLTEKLRKNIPASTEVEIQRAYEKYGSSYGIDGMPFEDAQRSLDTLVKEEKFRLEYSILLNNMRYENSIEKRLELLDEKK